MANDGNLKPPWAPGKSGNPAGKPKMSVEQKALRLLSKQQFSEIASLIVTGNWQVLQSIESDQSSTVLQRLIAKALLEAHRRGDWGTVDRLLDRLIGRPKENVEVSVLRRVVRRLDGSSVVYEKNNPADLE